MEQEFYKLPDGWVWRTIKELSEKVQYGHTTKAKSSGNAKFLRITDIQNGNINWETVPLVSVSSKDLEKYRLQSNDLVFARSGATSGKSILIRKAPANAIFASYLIRVIPSLNIIFPEFLALFFQSPIYWEQVEASASGAAQPNINGTKLSGFNIPLPTLDEQKRIVAKLDALFTRFDSAINHLQNTLELSRSLFASALDEAFDTEGHLVMSLNDVALLVSGQHLKKGEYTMTKTPESIPYLTGPAEFGEINPEPSRWTMTRRSIAIDGDTLITVKGSGVGKVNMMVAPEIAISRQLMAVRSKGQLYKKYLYLFFQARQQVFADKKTGAAIPGIGRRDVLEQVIPTPSLEEQHRIITHLDALSERTCALEAATEEKLRDLTALKASLLDAAFKGQL